MFVRFIKSATRQLYVEGDETKQEKLRRSREQDRLRRERETDEEQQARLVNTKLDQHKVKQDFVFPDIARLVS